ncbi:hypothetical protein ACVRZD_03020 [Streptococcus hongkongensis]
MIEEVGKVIDRGGSDGTSSSQSVFRMLALTQEQNLALAIPNVSQLFARLSISHVQAIM